VFVIAASLLSSTFERVISDSAGFGTSGIVYALVGFIWVARERDRNCGASSRITPSHSSFRGRSSALA